MAGLLLTAVAAWQLCSPARPHAWWRARPTAWRWLVAPQVAVAAGFWLTFATPTAWVLIVAGGSIGLAALAIRILTRPADHDPGVRRASVAVVLVTAQLVELGGLLAARLVISPDPAEGFLRALRPDAVREGGFTVLMPMAVIGGVLGIAVVGRRLVRRFPRVARRGDLWIGTPDQVDDMRRTTIMAVVALTTALFTVPMFGPANGEAYLTFAGVDTPEIAKVLFVALLAIVVARHGLEFYDVDAAAWASEEWKSLRAAPLTWSSARRSIRRATRKFGFAAFPVLLFGMPTLSRQLDTLLAVERPGDQ